MRYMVQNLVTWNEIGFKHEMSKHESTTHFIIVWLFPALTSNQISNVYNSLPTATNVCTHQILISTSNALPPPLPPLNLGFLNSLYNYYSHLTGPIVIADCYQWQAALWFRILSIDSKHKSVIRNTLFLFANCAIYNGWYFYSLRWL